ncbi:hypothetical protein [Prosthecobacter sp.]|uniref:hypothetical protein n=1 Tax=Prosthecobacter sp. TaxID=1965333 RepID=UPI001E0070AF|nr:hypothetical protein [Prosthecobacter sp.]MCB1279717.1 hypothetical protein [Prosthecobacter sp.]
MKFASLLRSGKNWLCVGAVLLVLTGCNVRWGMPAQGYGYPVGLSTFAPRLGGPSNFTYYPRFEAYYHPSTQQFYYPNGKKWETQPTLPGASPQDVLRTPGVPFQFPDHPSKYHAMVKQAFPPGWTPSSNRYQEGYEWGRSGWDLDRR